MKPPAAYHPVFCEGHGNWLDRVVCTVLLDVYFMPCRFISVANRFGATYYYHNHYLFNSTFQRVYVYLKSMFIFKMKFLWYRFFSTNGNSGT